MITHAKEGWKAKRIFDLIDLPSDEFQAYIPDFDYILFDAIKENPESYSFNKAVKALLTIWRYSDSPEFIQTLPKVFRLVQQICPEAKFKDFVITIIKYLSATRSEEEFIDIHKVAETEFSGREKFMGTIAEMFERKGYEKAIQEKDISSVSSNIRQSIFNWTWSWDNREQKSDHSQRNMRVQKPFLHSHLIRVMTAQVTFSITALAT